MNLSSLISEVLAMVKESQRRRRGTQIQDRWAESEQAARFRAGEESAKGYRAHQRALEMEKLKQRGTMAKRERMETGATARQRIGAGVRRYGSELGLKGQEAIARASELGHRLGLRGKREKIRSAERIARMKPRKPIKPVLGKSIGERGQDIDWTLGGSKETGYYKEPLEKRKKKRLYDEYLY